MAENDEASGKKGGIGSALRGILFKEEPPKPQPPGATAPASMAATSEPSRPALRVHTGAVAAADPEVRKVLEGAVKAAAKPAFSEFEAMAVSMSAVIADENTRFRAVLAALKPKGVTLDAILTDVDECLAALDEKERTAAAAAADARKQRVGTKEADLARITADVEAKRAKIASLQEEITALEAERRGTQEEIAGEIADIEQTQRRFTATVAGYRNDLKETKRKIALHGEGA